MVLLFDAGEPDAAGHAELVCRSLAQAPGLLSLSAACRRGRELEDGVRSIEWTADHAAQLGAEGARLILAGLHGGAAVAAALALRARDDGWPESRISSSSTRVSAPRAARTPTTRLSGVAPATVIGGDESSHAYATRLRRAGVPVKHLRDGDLRDVAARSPGSADAPAPSRRRCDRDRSARARVALRPARARLGQRALRRGRAVGGGLPGGRAARRRHGGVGAPADAEPADRPAALVHGAHARRPPGDLVERGAAGAAAEPLRRAAGLHARHARCTSGATCRGSSRPTPTRVRRSSTGSASCRTTCSHGPIRDRRAPASRATQPAAGLDLGLAVARAAAGLGAVRARGRPGGGRRRRRRGAAGPGWCDTLDPWPFGAACLTARCEGRRLAGRFDDDETMQDALAGAPWVTLDLELSAA